MVGCWAARVIWFGSCWVAGVGLSLRRKPRFERRAYCSIQIDSSENLPGFRSFLAPTPATLHQSPLPLAGEVAVSAAGEGKCVQCAVFLAGALPPLPGLQPDLSPKKGRGDWDDVLPMNPTDQSLHSITR